MSSTTKTHWTHSRKSKILLKIPYV